MLNIDSARQYAENFLFSPTKLLLGCTRDSGLTDSSDDFLYLLVGNCLGSEYALPELQRFVNSVSPPAFSPLLAMSISCAVAGVAYSFFSNPLARGTIAGLYGVTFSSFVLKSASIPSIMGLIRQINRKVFKSSAPNQEKKSSKPHPTTKTLQEAVLIWIGKEKLIEKEDLSAKDALTKAHVAASFLALALTKQVLAKSNHPIMANAAGAITLATLSALVLPIISSVNDHFSSKDKTPPSENALFCEKALALGFATYCAPKLLTDSSPLLIAAAQSASFLFFSMFLRGALTL